MIKAWKWMYLMTAQWFIFGARILGCFLFLFIHDELKRVTTATTIDKTKFLCQNATTKRALYSPCMIFQAADASSLLSLQVLARNLQHEAQINRDPWMFRHKPHGSALHPLKSLWCQTSSQPDLHPDLKHLNSVSCEWGLRSRPNAEASAKKPISWKLGSFRNSGQWSLKLASTCKTLLTGILGANFAQQYDSEPNKPSQPKSLGWFFSHAHCLQVLR